MPKLVEWKSFIFNGLANQRRHTSLAAATVRSYVHPIVHIVGRVFVTRSGGYVNLHAVKPPVKRDPLYVVSNPASANPPHSKSSWFNGSKWTFFRGERVL